MRLTGLSVVVVLVVLSVAAPVALVVWSVCRPVRRRFASRAFATVTRMAGIAVCEALVLALVFVMVNRTYGFYAGWGDLFGVSHPQPRLLEAAGTHSGTVRTGTGPRFSSRDELPTGGRLVTFTVHGQVSHTTLPVTVWLPPEYFEAGRRHHRFPVLMFLSPVTDAVALFKVIPETQAAVRAHRMQPAVVVFPPVTIRPGFDSECVDFPHGPLAASWLTYDVRSAVLHGFRVSSPARDWALFGWSTGGYCAVKLYLHHPDLFGSAVSMGGYFAPAFDKTDDPALHRAEQNLVATNSPLLRFRTHPPRSAQMLLVTSRQDPESWHGFAYADEREMSALVRNVPGVAQINLSIGGHRVNTYLPAVPDIMTWLGHHQI